MADKQRGSAKVQGVTRVLLVDDHPLVRERLAEAIQREPELTVCGEAEDQAGALEKIAVTRPDLVILDLALKQSNGFDLMKEIHTCWPELAVLVVSMHDEALYAERAIRTGARGYITKQEATTKILLALHAVRRGEMYLSEKMALQMARQAARHPRAKPGFGIDQLSDRESRVFDLIGQGRSTRNIATELDLEVRTVETYRARIKEKLGLRDANELLQSAIRWNQSGGLT